MSPPVDQMTPPATDMIEILMTLSPRQYEEMGADLQAIRERLDLPTSASNSQVIQEAVRRQARPG